MRKKLLFLMLTLFCLACGRAWAQSFNQGAFTFVVTDADAKTVSVFKSNYISYLGGDLVIPSTVSYAGVTYMVTSVAGSGFADTDISSVTIPETIEILGDRAFANCNYITNINIADSERNLELTTQTGGTYTGTFVGCAADKTIYIGRNLTYSGGDYSPFNSVTSVEFGEKVTSIHDNLFINSNKIRSVIIGNGVTTIGEGAFYQAGIYSSVNEMVVTLGENITSIGQRAFYGCSKLKTITIPPLLKNIGFELFANCGLTSISIPASVNIVDNRAFANCNYLTNINIADSERNLKLTTQTGGTYTGTFVGCAADKTIYIGRNLTYSGDFSPFTSVTSVEFGEKVTKLQPYMFMYNGNPTFSSVKVPWQTPINITQNVFNDATYQGATLIVPGGTLNAYKAHQVWKKFLNMQLSSYVVTGTATAGGTLKFAGETVTNGTKKVTVDRGTDVTFEVTPDENYEFTNLTVNNVPVNVTNNTYTYTNLLKDITVKATFTEKPKFDIVATATGGTVSLNGATPSDSQTINVYRDTDVTLDIQAYEGHYLSAVTINGEDVTDQIQNNTLRLENIQEAKTIVVTFLKYTYTVTIAGAGVTVSSTTPEYGDDVTVTIDDDPDRELVSLLVNGQDVTAQVVNGQFVIQNVTENVTVEATFISTKEFITMTSSYATFSCPKDLNFTGCDLCAYVALGFNKATCQVILARVYDVPAGTGVFLIGQSGMTYKIPYAETTSYYSNLFLANLQQSIVSATTGNYVNYIFDEKDGDAGFYPIDGQATLQAQTAYLQLLSSFVAAGVKVSIAFEDDVIDGIVSPGSETEDETIYNLAGQRIGKMQSGIYIVGGRKIMMK